MVHDRLSKYKLKVLKWKCAFRIIWQTPSLRYIDIIKNGKLHSVTRFGFEVYKKYSFRKNFKNIKKAPCDLIKEYK